MKPDILRQKIESLVGQVDNMEFLEELYERLKEQRAAEQKESIYEESLKSMHKRRSAKGKRA